MNNKIYVIEYKGPNYFDGNSHFVIVVAAENASLAQEYVKNKIGINLEPVLLLNAAYPTIYTQDGNSPEPIQAKILYNGNCHFYKTKKQ